MLEEFKAQRVDVDEGVQLHVRSGGSGPPLLLLHGYPQSNVMWHKVTPALAHHFTLVMPDLRGYGLSDKPAGGDDHVAYSKRIMARDLVRLMERLGWERFAVAGHDRGGRVAHRLAVDHPDAVSRLMLLDIAPTLAMYEQTDMAFAQAYWWWFFLIQPAPFPETLIAAQPEVFLRKKIGYGRAGLAPFTSDAYAAYLRNVSDPDTLRGMCEDYRAAATIDLEHDRADRDSGLGMRCPVRALWGEHGVVHRCFKPLEEWRKVTRPGHEVTGKPLPCGHYIAEEIPEMLTNEMLDYFVEKK